jgi:iron complex transport system substrate-binding protein
MGQPRRALQAGKFAIAALCLFLGHAGCSRPAPPPPAADAPIRVASTTPAGTDLLIAIGGADNLVAVSDFDDDREGTAGKPRIGDYQNIDWEKLASVRPQYLLLEESEDRISDAIRQRCSDLGIQIVNLKIENLQDIESTMMQLAIVVHRGVQAAQAIYDLQATLAAIQARTSAAPPVRTLIVTSDDGLSVAGPGTFLDNLLTMAGGKNAAAGIGRPYTTLDPEMLASLSPDVIIQLIPDAQRTPQVMDQVTRFWTSIPNLPAVKNRRVYVLTDWFALEPGSHVGRLAEEFADVLHPDLKP